MLPVFYVAASVLAVQARNASVYKDATGQFVVHLDAPIDRVNAVAVKCQDRIQELKRCENPIDCERKTMAKDVCVGELVCPREVKAFMKVLETPKSSEEETFQAYGSLLKCNSKFQEDGEKLFN